MNINNKELKTEKLDILDQFLGINQINATTEFSHQEQQPVNTQVFPETSIDDYLEHKQHNVNETHNVTNIQPTTNTTQVLSPVEESKPQEKPVKKHKLSNFDDDASSTCFNIKIFGIGGAGCNVINSISANNPAINEMATLFALNTDAASLRITKNVTNRFLLNKEKLKGYGSGGNPEIGREAVASDAAIIEEELAGTDILFIVSGLGKGTGSGGSPEVARIAKKLGILTVAIVNLPSLVCEGNEVYNNAFENIKILEEFCDSITTISNERIINNETSVPFFKAYGLANEEIANIILQILNIVYKASIMNIDFSDLKNFFIRNKYFLLNNISISKQETNPETIQNLIEQKIESSYSDISVENAKDVIVNISMNPDTQSAMITDLRNAFANITLNKQISLVSGIDENERDKTEISFLLSGKLVDTFTKKNNEIPDFDASHKPKEVKKSNDIDELTRLMNRKDFDDELAHNGFGKSNDDFEDEIG